MSRPRRASSNLGGDPRGDTSAPALATMTKRSHSQPSAKERELKPHSKRRKARSAFRKWMQISTRHTWLNPLVIMVAILAAYFINPGEQNPLHKAIFLSYPLGPDYEGGPNMYGKGKADIAFVAFYTVVLSFTREFLMQRMIRPLALKCGIKKKAKQARFMEQVYTAIYFSIFGPFGLYVMSRGPLWYFNTTAMFEGFPHRKHEALFKAYYLLQAAYWAQQAIVLMLQLEKPRKDFKELVLHHIVTLALIILSYRFHFTHMGIAVYITHDISDFFLATSKTLNYLDSPIVGPYFGLFMVVWIYLRHYINLQILWATLTEFRTVGPYELDWETQQYKCWISQIITFALLASLQAVNLFWLFLILRIAKNYVFANIVADERSDDEDEDEEEQQHDTKSNGKIVGEADVQINGTTPAVLINGEPVEDQPNQDAVRARRRKG
ncbi:sphingosine N-acyltransferase lag1 [Exophiala dermatitidis]|uniref:Sphingosine N-acyltransferase lag1 n=1 Tax=Exophiala dermatitidis TaxID=5970 RepID=A0AAN6ESF1_EXODE|nr:sphingosine N-acyltransferase lag1 [Exophiala dermatitidis]KAJ4517414.1 sphingosine N-acyltransferase lag1 [Exophiala dermatitidis]KAJ4548835.1 sphingosine N-acyltransferase lag1 [Exophiala dermatitidis]KAJ4550619.1 sphingosine N-acyltransferase lag1 [Exophiala dermatitidis]KAJ4552444.1 sphingosine N-acyltransferase lag1 [Exophiala dermatitidis]